MADMLRDGAERVKHPSSDFVDPVGFAQKSEIRISKSETKPKHEIRIRNNLLDHSFRIFDFGLIRVCFGFRYSDFGFQAKPTWQRQSGSVPDGGFFPIQAQGQALRATA